MTTETNITLELNDIQAGALRRRPTPYTGAYFLLRIDERQAGREFVRRLIPALASAADPDQPAWLAASLTFQLAPTTDVLILNVPKISLAPGAEILVSDGGGPASWIVNLGPDGKAVIKKDAFLEAPLLSPNAGVSVPDGAFTDAIFTTEGVKLQGAGILSTLECED